MNELINTIKEFVEGNLSCSDLEIALCSDNAAETLGKHENPKYPNSSNHYLRIQKQDTTTLGGIINIQGILEDFLTKSKVSFIPSCRYYDQYNILLESLPEFVSTDEDIVIPLLNDLKSKSKKAKIKELKERLSSIYSYSSRPPKWIQDPEWPIINNTPCKFICQTAIDDPDLFHDAGEAYIFFSKSTGEFISIYQFH